MHLPRATIPNDLSKQTDQPVQPKWTPAAEKGFAAAIILMVAIPIFTVFAIVIRRRLQGYFDSEVLENEHWERTMSTQVERLPTQRDADAARSGPVKRWWRRLIYVRPRQQINGGAPGGPGSGVVSPGEAGPAARRTSVRTAIPLPIAETGMMQGTIPPSGPRVGGNVGGGPCAGDPTMYAAPRPRLSIASIDATAGQSRRTSYDRDSRRDRMRRASRARIYHNIPEHDNIPMAMPVRPSRSGEPLRRYRERQYHSPASSIRSRLDQRRRNQRSTRDRVSDLIASVRGENRAPPNTEIDHDAPGSPQTDGQSDDEPPVRTRRARKSPVESMRRTQAVSRVVEATQSFLGGYPDLQCLLGSISQTDISAPSRPTLERKAKTNHF